MQVSERFQYPALSSGKVRKWKRPFDNSKMFGALLADLSKAFDCLYHELLIAIWMCHSCANNSKTNRLHKRCLRIIYSDKHSSFETMLGKDGSVSVCNRNV